MTFSRAMGHRTIVAFKLMCVVLSLYMVQNQIESYFRNQDMSQITLRTFNQRSEDKYPTFTTCLKSENGFIYPEDVTDELEVSKKDYTNILRGEPNSKNMSEESIKTILRKDYDNFSIKLHTLLTNFTFRTRHETETISYSVKLTNSTNFEQIKRNFYISHQDSSQTCYTRTSDLSIDRLIRKKDYVHFNFAHLVQHFEENYNSPLEGSLQIFIHHPLQFMRSMDKPVFDISFTDIKSKSKKSEKTRTYFDIAFVSLLRKRADADTPCNATLHNDDNFFRIKVVNDVGCIPNYWMSLMDEKKSHDLCTSRRQLRKIHWLIKHSSKPFSSYPPPCVEMQIPVNVRSVIVNGNKGDFSFVVSYTAEEYQEITNVRGFNLMTLWSNAGGYVGIFLGYSLLQVAEVIDNEWKRFWDSFYRCIRNSIYSIIMILRFFLCGSK